MVDAHYNHILLGKTHARIPLGCAAVESATMKPEHDGFLRLHIGGPDVEHAAIL